MSDPCACFRTAIAMALGLFPRIFRSNTSSFEKQRLAIEAYRQNTKAHAANHQRAVEDTAKHRKNLNVYMAALKKVRVTRPLTASEKVRAKAYMRLCNNAAKQEELYAGIWNSSLIQLESAENAMCTKHAAHNLDAFNQQTAALNSTISVDNGLMHAVREFHRARDSNAHSSDVVHAFRDELVDSAMDDDDEYKHDESIVTADDDLELLEEMSKISGAYIPHTSVPEIEMSIDIHPLPKEELDQLSAVDAILRDLPPVPTGSGRNGGPDAAALFVNSV